MSAETNNHAGCKTLLDDDDDDDKNEAKATVPLQLLLRVNDYSIS